MVVEVMVRGGRGRDTPSNIYVARLTSLLLRFEGVAKVCAGEGMGWGVCGGIG